MHKNDKHLQVAGFGTLADAHRIRTLKNNAIKKQDPQTKTEVPDRHIWFIWKWHIINLYRTSITSLFQNGLIWGLDWHVGLFLFKSLKCYRRVKQKSFQVFRDCLIFLLAPFVSLLADCWWFVLFFLHFVKHFGGGHRWSPDVTGSPASVASCSEGPPSRLKWCTNPKANQENCKKTEENSRTWN